MKPLFYICFLSLLLGSCATNLPPIGQFDATRVPAAPNYANPSSWAALPGRFDVADSIVAAEYRVANLPDVDVFYIYPTQYPQNNKKDRDWNAPINDADFNAHIDVSAMLYQATLFNAAGQMYAPRYRQGHYEAYFTTDTASAKATFELAYQDIQAAFEYYLANYNHGRPVMIVGHSQGTQHAQRLIRAFYDGTPRQSKLVAAYLPGMPIRKDYFKSIKPCETPEQTGCYCTWRTFRRDYVPTDRPRGTEFAATNPLTWRTDTLYAPKLLNRSALLPKLKVYHGISDAQVHDGYIWTTKPKFRGSFFVRNPNFHVGDYNLFYGDVRANARLRAETYLQNNPR